MVRHKVEFTPIDQTRYQAQRTSDKIACMERKLADLKGKMMDLSESKNCIGSRRKKAVLLLRPDRLLLLGLQVVTLLNSQ